jgi:hypothetical protein
VRGGVRPEGLTVKVPAVNKQRADVDPREVFKHAIKFILAEEYLRRRGTSVPGRAPGRGVGEPILGGAEGVIRLPQRTT